MKLSKEDIQEIKEGLRTLSHNEVDGFMCAYCATTYLIETIEALHTSIATLADSFESVGLIAEAKEVRGLGE